MLIFMARSKQPGKPMQTAKGRTARVPLLTRFHPSFRTLEERMVMNQLVQDSAAARQEIEQEIQKITDGLGALSRNRRPQAEFRLQQLREQRKNTLTPRETEVMTAYIKQIGQSGKPDAAAVAGTLGGIGVTKINVHVKSARRKLWKMMLARALADGTLTQQELQQEIYKSYAGQD